MWFWNVTEIFLIISFGVEVVEVIKFDFSPNIYQDVLVVFTLIIQNISVWQYLNRRHQHATWDGIKAVVMVFVSISITDAAIHGITNDWFDLAITVIMIVLLNVFFFVFH